jgi:hypothetical protein
MPWKEVGIAHTGPWICNMGTLGNPGDQVVLEEVSTMLGQSRFENEEIGDGCIYLQVGIKKWSKGWENVEVKRRL